MIHKLNAKLSRLMRVFLLVIFSLVALVGTNAQTVTAKEKAALSKIYTDFCKQLNAQLPITVDEVTELRSVAFINWTMTINYYVSFSADDFTESELKELSQTMKQQCIENSLVLFKRGDYAIKQSEFKEMLRVIGMKLRFNYYDENNVLLFPVILDYRNF